MKCSWICILNQPNCTLVNVSLFQVYSDVCARVDFTSWERMRDMKLQLTGQCEGLDITRSPDGLHIELRGHLLDIMKADIILQREIRNLTNKVKKKEKKARKMVKTPAVGLVDERRKDGPDSDQDELEKMRHGVSSGAYFEQTTNKEENRENGIVAATNDLHSSITMATNHHGDGASMATDLHDDRGTMAANEDTAVPDLGTEAPSKDRDINICETGGRVRIHERKVIDRQHTSLNSPLNTQTHIEQAFSTLPPATLNTSQVSAGQRKVFRVDLYIGLWIMRKYWESMQKEFGRKYDADIEGSCSDGEVRITVTLREGVLCDTSEQQVTENMNSYIGTAENRGVIGRSLPVTYKQSMETITGQNTNVFICTDNQRGCHVVGDNQDMLDKIYVRLKSENNDHKNGDQGTENMNSDQGTENMNSDQGTENMNSDQGTENMNSDQGTENMNSDQGTENGNSDWGTENRNSDRGTENGNSDWGTENRNSDRGTENKNSDRSTENRISDRGTENRNRDQGTENRNSNRGTENRNSDRGTKNRNRDRGTENRNSNRGTENRNSDSNGGGCDNRSPKETYKGTGAIPKTTKTTRNRTMVTAENQCEDITIDADTWKYIEKVHMDILTGIQTTYSLSVKQSTDIVKVTVRGIGKDVKTAIAELSALSSDVRVSSEDIDGSKSKLTIEQQNALLNRMDEKFSNVVFEKQGIFYHIIGPQSILQMVKEHLISRLGVKRVRKIKKDDKPMSVTSTTGSNLSLTTYNPSTTTSNPSRTTYNPSTTTYNPSTTTYNPSTTTYNPSTTAGQSHSRQSYSRPVYSGPVYSGQTYGYKHKTKVYNIHIFTGDITQCMTSAIVNAADDRLNNGGGVAKAISKAAGPEFDLECKSVVKKNGPLKVSKPVMTNGFQLPCQQVIHVVGPKWDDYKNKKQCMKDLHDTFYNCMRKANNRKCGSVAIPAVSSGILLSF